MVIPQDEILSLPEKRTYSFRFAYSFLLLDYLSRWISYSCWRLGIINSWVFWIGQAAVIPIILFILVANRSANVKQKYNIHINEVINPESTLFSSIFALGGVLLGAYVSFTLYKEWRLWVRIVFAASSFLFYGMHIALLYANSVQTKAKEDDIPAPIVLSVDEWIDANDREIIRLETDKISLSQRVDTYTLESTLFGALSFSGFVTIIASEKPILAGTRELVIDLSQIGRMILQFQFSGLKQTVLGITTESALFAAIAVETLICSMFFLSVIVSRLRFNDALKRVDYAVRVAIAYNNKEEEVYNLTLQEHSAEIESAIRSRLDNLKTKISDAVYHSEESFRNLTPIVNYMWVSRNLGLLSFLLILITGALWISPILALLFASLSVLAYVYTMLDSWVRARNFANTGLIHYFSRRAGLFPMPTRRVNK